MVQQDAFTASCGRKYDQPQIAQTDEVVTPGNGTDNGSSNSTRTAQTPAARTTCKSMMQQVGRITWLSQNKPVGDKAVERTLQAARAIIAGKQ